MWPGWTVCLPAPPQTNSVDFNLHMISSFLNHSQSKRSTFRLVCRNYMLYAVYYIRCLAQTAPSPDVGVFVCSCVHLCALCVVFVCVNNWGRQTSLPALPSFASANGSMIPVSDHCNYPFKFLLHYQMGLSLSFSLSCLHHVTALLSVLCISKQQFNRRN